MVLGSGRGFSLFLIAVLILAGGAHAEAGQWKKARLVQPKPCAEGRCAVIWKSTAIEVKFDEKRADQPPFVELRGVLTRRDWGLASGERALKPHPETGEFVLRLRLSGRVTQGTLYAISPFGKTEQVKFAIVFDGYEAYFEGKRKGADPQGKAVYSFGVGTTMQSYAETGIAPFEQLALTGKLSAQRAFGWPWQGLASRWVVGGTAYLTLFPISTNREGTQMRFFGANARLGYKFAGMPSGWDLGLWTGVYYTAIIGTERGRNSFGVQNLTGPQVFPTLAKKLGERSSVATYFKFAPVSAEGLQFSGFPAREIAFGVSYAHVLFGTVVSLSADLARLHGVIEESEIDSTSTTIGLGVSW